MNNYLMVTLSLFAVILLRSSVRAQEISPGFEAAPLEIKPVAKTAPHPITSIDLLKIRDVVGIQISPDGKSVAYVVSQAVLESNSYRTALFVVGTAPGSVPINLGSAGPPQWNAAGQYMKVAPQWSPDSRYITYLMGEKDKKQIWCWSKNGGKPEQLTHNSDDVESYEWQPDGKRIIFTTIEPISPEELKKVSEQGIVYESYDSADFYGAIRAWEGRPIARAAIETKTRKKQNWIYDCETRTEKKLTAEENSEYSELHQPSSKAISGQKSYVINSKASPDGKLIANVLFINDPYISFKWTSAISIKQTGENDSRELIPPLKEGIVNVWWGKNSDEVYFDRMIEDKGWFLYAISVRGGVARELIKNNKDMLSAFSFDESMSRVACLRESPTKPPEIAVVDLKEGVPRMLVNINPEFQNIKLAPVIRLEWTNKYGDYAFGYLIKPLNYEPGKRYPLIITTYFARGFLRGDMGDEYPAQVFATNNFAVLCLDLLDADDRISTPGDFKAAMIRFYSAEASLVQATKTLDDMGITDPKRKGLAGLSYGTEVTQFTISHSDLFQTAIVSGGGARDPIFYYLTNGFWHKRFSYEWGLGFPNGQAAERWKELSPALNAARVNAALLINAADSEYLPGLQLYTALRELNKPVELIIYADEGHIKIQPKHRYEIYERNVDWLNFWLQDKEDPDPAKSKQYSRWEKMRKKQKVYGSATDRLNSSVIANSP